MVLNRKIVKSKTGLYPIRMHITIDRESRYYKIAVPQKVSYKDWLGLDDNWARPSHPFAFEINNKIIEKKNVAHDLIKRSYNFNKSLSFDTIFQHLKNKGDPKELKHLERDRDMFLFQIYRLSISRMKSLLIEP